MATVTSVTKHFPVAKEGFTTTLASTISSGAATVPLNSVTGYSNGDTVVLVVEPGESNKQVFTGVVDTSGVQITGVVWTEGTNVTHNAGSTVVDYVTATHMSMVTKGLLVSHNPSGTMITSLPLTTPKITTSINDANGNEVIKTPATSSAVNEVTVTNAATGSGPNISATGDDTNIDLNLTPKGTGVLKIGGNSVNAGAWTSYTPTIATGGLGNGTIAAYYCQIGKAVFFRIQFTLGSTSSFPSGSTFTLPATATTTGATAANSVIIGTASFNDTSAGTLYIAFPRLESSTTVRQLYLSTAAGATQSGVPATPATNDIIFIQGSYEAA